MPYLCLTRSDIPDGTLQITDLWPNTSLRNNSIDPPGQTRYINRVQNDPMTFVAGGGGDISALRLTRGLAAYLADRVSPGGTQAAVTTVQAVGPLVADTIILGGVTLTAVEDYATGTLTVGGATAAGDTVNIAGIVTASGGANGFIAVNPGPANAANGEFLDVAASGSAIATATSLVAAINEVTTIAPAITAALDALVAANPGGTITADNAGGTSAVVTLTSSVAGLWGDAPLAEVGGNITLSGATMTHTDPSAAGQEFGSAAHYADSLTPNISVATSIAATMNNVATDALLIASATGGTSVTAANGGTDTVTVTADTTGAVGAMPIVVNNAVRLVLPSAALTDYMQRTMEAWSTADIALASAALIARMDAGLALAEADMNTAINGASGTISGVDVAHASGTSSVRDILEILSGRGYDVAAGAQFASATGRWESALTPVGSFTNARLVNDSQMVGGEWRPLVIGGDSSPVEKKGIRYTVDGGSLSASFNAGQIAFFRQALATLFPHNDWKPFFPTPSQPGPDTAQVNTARVLVIYNDDGSLVV